MRKEYFEKYSERASKGMHFTIPLNYEGRKRSERIAELRERLEKAVSEGKAAYPFRIADPEYVSWLTNIRGWDNEWTLAANLKAELREDAFILYADMNKLTDGLKGLLSAEGIELRELKEAEDASWNEAESDNVSSEKAELFEMIPKHIKNEKEAENMRHAHDMEGVAAVRLMKWLKGMSPEELESIGEIEVSDKLEEIRNQIPGYICPSFDTIAAYNEHASGIKIEDFHYDPTEETSVKLSNKGFFLLDFGAQYPGGTTDCTRTFALGKPDKEAKKHYTTVLKAVFGLSEASFSRGVTGVGLDALSRRHIYRLGMDFGHGTGHGVGYMLNVHETPASVRPRIAKENADILPLEEGMIFSVEPGIYLKGSYGIRLENLVLVQKDEELSKAAADGFHDDFLRLETLTMVPYDMDAIDPALLTAEERTALDSHHRRVCERLKEYLTEEEYEWLADFCKPKSENYKFHQNKECEFFPCHKTDDPENFNCLFCYCPLYALGEGCGGNFKILENGFKDCSGCLIPHRRAGYDYIIGKYPEIIELVNSVNQKRGEGK